jgi:hypothetical protein
MNDKTTKIIMRDRLGTGILLPADCLLSRDIGYTLRPFPAALNGNRHPPVWSVRVLAARRRSKHTPPLAGLQITRIVAFAGAIEHRRLKPGVTDADQSGALTF